MKAMIRTTMLCALMGAASMALAQKKTSGKKDTMAHYDYPQVYTVVEQMPEYPGGEPAMYQFIKQNVRFPSDKRRDSTFTGCKTYIKMIIDSTGKVTEPAVIKQCQRCSECDAEAIRVVKLMPVWKPGKHNGRPVSTYYTLPFSFNVR